MDQKVRRCSSRSRGESTESGSAFNLKPWANRTDRPIFTQPSLCRPADISSQFSNRSQGFNLPVKSITASILMACAICILEESSSAKDFSKISRQAVLAKTSIAFVCRLSKKTSFENLAAVAMNAKSRLEGRRPPRSALRKLCSWKYA
jgi:hypothetical protein